MALIECITGPADTPIGSETYSFQRDKHGRFVAEVANLKHVAVLCSLAEVYREVREEPNAPAPADARTAELADRVATLGDLLDERDTKIVSLQSELDRASTSIATLEAANKDLAAHLEKANAEIADLTELLDDAGPGKGGGGGGAGADDGSSQSDDIRDLAGLGDAAAVKLATKNITTFAQLAALTPDQMKALDTELDLRGASERNDWIGQAKAKLTERKSS